MSIGYGGIVGGDAIISGDRCGPNEPISGISEGSRFPGKFDHKVNRDI